MKKTQRLLLGFFSLLIIFNFFAPTFFTYLLSQRNVVYAQDDGVVDPATTSADGGAESVSAGVSCFDTTSKEKDIWDKASGWATHPVAVVATGGLSLGFGLGAKAAGKVGDVLNFVNNPLKWFVCGASALLTGAINFLNKTLNRLMLFDPTKNNDEVNRAYKADCETSAIKDEDCTSFTSLGPEGTNRLKEIWRGVLNISNIFLILGFLIMVISTALDMSIFSSYTVKKVLPKIIIAAIAANLSWVICSTVISGVNYVGIGIQSVMINPYTESVDSSLGDAVGQVTTEAVESGGTVFQGGVAVGLGTVAFAIFASAGAILLPLLAFILLAVLIAFIMFLLRRIIIILLVMAAPLAFMAWAIPGGEQWFKKWWKAFTQVLLVYPYAMILFGAGIMISGVIGQTNTADDGALGDIINAFLMIIALLLPYFLLPTAFKMIGGALGTITGKLNDKSKGFVDRAKNAKENSSYYAGKKGAKDAKIAGKRQEATAAKINSYMQGRGLGSKMYRKGMSETQKARLEASSDKALVDSTAEGFVHKGYSGNDLQKIVRDTSMSKHERQGALKAMADQGLGDDLLASQAFLDSQGTQGHKLWNEVQGTNYNAFGAASPAAKVKLGGVDSKTGQPLDLNKERAKKFAGLSLKEASELKDDHWKQFYAADPLKATQKHADASAVDGGRLQANLKHAGWGGTPNPAYVTTPPTPPPAGGGGTLPNTPAPGPNPFGAGAGVPPAATGGHGPGTVRPSGLWVPGNNNGNGSNPTGNGGNPPTPPTTP